MANVTSQLMTNEIASPRQVNKVGEKHARTRTDIARFNTGAAPGTNVIYRLTKLKATDRVIAIHRVSDADAGLTACTIGIYTPSNDTTDPVAVDADAFFVSGSLTSAAAIPQALMGSGNTNPEDFGKPIWEYAPTGPATEPDRGAEYEICMAVGGNPVGSDHAFLITYLAGD